MKHAFTDEQIIDAFEDAELAGDWKAFRTFLDHLPEPAADDMGQQIQALLDMTGTEATDTPNATHWLATLNKYIRDNGVYDTLWALIGANTERRIFPDDIKKLGRSTEEAEPEPWEECKFEDIRKGDRVKRVLIYDSGTAEIREGVVANKDIHFASCTQRRILSSSEDLNSTIVKLYRIPAPVQHPDPLEHPVIIDPHTTDDEVFDYAVWDAEDFYLCYTHEGEFMRVAEPSEITKFTPAKVVEDDR